MAVRPTHAANEAEEPGESDDDPGMDVETMAEDLKEFDPPPPVRARHESPHGPVAGSSAPGSQVSERSLAAEPGPLAAKGKSEEELEQEGFYGNRRPKMLGDLRSD